MELSLLWVIWSRWTKISFYPWFQCTNCNHEAVMVCSGCKKVGYCSLFCLNKEKDGHFPCSPSLSWFCPLLIDPCFANCSLLLENKLSYFSAVLFSFWSLEVLGIAMYSSLLWNLNTWSNETKLMISLIIYILWCIYNWCLYVSPFKSCQNDVHKGSFADLSRPIEIGR